MNDIQFGFGAPVNFFGPSVATRVSVGGRYIKPTAPTTSDND